MLASAAAALVLSGCAAGVAPPSAGGNGAAAGDRPDVVQHLDLLAGLVLQAVTGRPVEATIRRIMEPLHLEDVYWPGAGT